MVEVIGYAICVEGDSFNTLVLNKHEFTKDESIEILLRLLGYSRRPKNFIDLKNNIKENQINNDFFEDFLTSAKFNDEWFDVYSVDEMTDNDKLKFILLGRKSNSSVIVLATLREMSEAAIRLCPAKAKEISSVFEEYSKGELLLQLAKEGMDPKDPKPALKGLMEKLKKVKESAKAEVQAVPETVQSEIATNLDTQEAKMEDGVNILGQVQVEQDIPLNELPIIKFTQPLVNPVVNNTLNNQQQPCVPLHVINFVNVYTLSPSVTDQEKQYIFDQLGRTFAKQDVVNYILQRQNKPLFNIIHVDPNRIVLQSIQPGCPVVEVNITSDGGIEIKP